MRQLNTQETFAVSGGECTETTTTNSNGTSTTTMTNSCTGVTITTVIGANGQILSQIVCSPSSTLTAKVEAALGRLGRFFSGEAGVSGGQSCKQYAFEVGKLTIEGPMADQW
jgi:hypothetical protein